MLGFLQEIYILFVVFVRCGAGPNPFPSPVDIPDHSSTADLSYLGYAHSQPSIKGHLWGGAYGDFNQPYWRTRP